MFADLHLHSVYSDGWYTPEELCKRAVSRGLSLISITDHDTMAGLEVKRECAARHGLLYLSGWEISAYDKDNKIHILGYNCAQNVAYDDFTRRCAEGAFLRAEDSVRKLQGVGISVTVEEVLAERSAPDLPVHTMHVARAIARKLKITETAAYAEFLGYGKIASSMLGRPTPQEAIDCIHACGGIASIAHPGRIFLSFEERERLIFDLADYGLDGIECTYTTHTKEDAEYFLALSRKLGLLATGGSDTHFEETSHQIGSPRFTPSAELLERVNLR